MLVTVATGQWMPLKLMRDHPIPAVTEPLQYRAIGVVRGIFKPESEDQPTRGHLVDADGQELEAVVLGRMLTLMRRHLDMSQPHLWVVYPRCREAGQLHLQIAGIWEPSTLAASRDDADNVNPSLDELPEGDDYFSIRGELIYTKPESSELVIKVRQLPQADGFKPLPFKLQLSGDVELAHLRHFVSLDVRRQGQVLQVGVGGGDRPHANPRRKGRGSASRRGGAKGPELAKGLHETDERFTGVFPNHCWSCSGWLPALRCSAPLSDCLQPGLPCSSAVVFWGSPLMPPSWKAWAGTFWPKPCWWSLPSAPGGTP